MKANLSMREFEQFSAYLDGQLSPVDTKRMEEQLRVNPEWRLAIEELAATRNLLRSAPRYRAPRNFTISPEMARSLARKPLFPPFPVFRFSTALAVLSMLAVGVLQAIGMGSPLGSNRIAMAPQAVPAMEAAPMSSDAAEKSLAAEPGFVFQWSQPLGMGGGDGMNAPLLESEAAKGTYPSMPGGGIVTYGDQAPPAYASGMGGGMGGGGGMPSQSLTLPPSVVASEETADQTELPQESPPESARSAGSQSQGSGPILGVPAPGEGGQIIASSGPIPVDAAAQSGMEDHGFNPVGISALRIAQIVLGGLAILALVAALFFRARRI
jgi:hypothetical protein